MGSRCPSLVGAALAMLASLAAPSAYGGEGLSELDLTGHWYVWLQYRDERSEDKSLVHFKDFAWSIRAREDGLTWSTFPYVTFSDEVEAVRRQALMAPKVWAPDESLVAALRRELPVSPRAADEKRLSGSREQGYASPPPISSGGLHSIGFSRTWRVDFGEKRVRIVVTDSLSGTAALEGMEDSVVYEITGRSREGDAWVGRYRDGSKHGELRMIRCAALRVQGAEGP